MPKRDKTIANEALQIRPLPIPGRNPALCLGLKNCRVADLAGLSDPNYHLSSRVSPPGSSPEFPAGRMHSGLAGE